MSYAQSPSGLWGILNYSAHFHLSHESVRAAWPVPQPDPDHANDLTARSSKIPSETSNQILLPHFCHVSPAFIIEQENIVLQNKNICTGAGMATFFDNHSCGPVKDRQTIHSARMAREMLTSAICVGSLM